MNPYRLLSFYRDLKAIRKGRLPQRIVRKHVYRHAMRAAGFLSRILGVGR